MKPARPNPWLERRPFNWAHRGGAKEAPANTLFGFAEALKNGADGLELDVHATSDGALVVSHDKRLGKMTKERWPIRARTLSDLKSVDAAYWWTPGKVYDHDEAAPHPHRGKAASDPAFQIPTLSEVFDAFPDVSCNIELKRPKYQKTLADLLNDRPPDLDIVVSFWTSVIRRFAKFAPNAATAASTAYILYVKLRSLLVPAQRRSRHVALQAPEYLRGIPIVTRRFVKRAHRAGLAVHVWTIDEPRVMDRLLDLGVDGIITDKPSVLEVVLRERRPRERRPR